jgi:SAM-dependent methyltransferase
MTALSTEIVDRFACPVCGAPGNLRALELVCGGGHAFSLQGGLAVLVRGEAIANDSHKLQQAHYYGSATSETWEVERPQGAPAFHAWLLKEKFRRSIRGVESLVKGASVLSVCGGSGMDAELLSLAGSSPVVVADISSAAATRVAERSRRHGVPLVPVVADIECLPFADRSFDLVYVHDGLHHLEDPARGLAEMMRVARRAVSVTEPAAALATRGAVRLGWAADVEEAGNVVRRLRVRDVVSSLQEADFSVVAAERYGMYYAHEPGRPAYLLSREPLFSLARVALRLANGALGNAVGNKMTIQAVRRA